MDLILNTYGVALNRDNEGFVITNSDGRQRVPVTGITSIQVSRGACITSDAVMLAIENEIEVLFMDKVGNPAGRIWSPKYGSISTIRKGQLRFVYNHDSLNWIKEVLCRKIQNQQAQMLMIDSSQSAEATAIVQKNIHRLDDYITKIGSLDGEIVNDVAAQLRGWEGLASRIYFSTMNISIPERFRFEQRSQHPATDVANAMLNYGYGLLYGRIEGDMIKAGIDPYIGVMHRDNYNRPVLVFDVIEIYRVFVDYVVYSLLAQDVVTDEYYSMREDGSCWLEVLGRRVLIQSLNDYLDETVLINGVDRSRDSHIFLYIQGLAQKFKDYEKC
jgi:CRISPR-associated protein Cas1